MTGAVIKAVVAAALGVFVLVPGVFAHSLHELETELGSREKYFQPIDKAAPDFTLQDAGSRSVSLADFRGKVVVLHFIYTHCPDVCPLHAERIAEIQSLVNQSPMKQQVEFITVTTDPTRDRGDVLTDYGKAHGLDPANWIFLTTKRDQAEDETRKLAEQFGHRFDKTEDGYQTHGIVTHVIDKEGRWRANFHGLKFEPSNLVIFVNALVNDFNKHPNPAPTLWDRLKSWF
ncbi:MAG: SCO family protein [Pseudolabrys sp.]|jgi:protein SCO1/2|nr:SCO family protein [Pseudolabrys sp.]